MGHIYNHIPLHFHVRNCTYFLVIPLNRMVNIPLATLTTQLELNFSYLLYSEYACLSLKAEVKISATRRHYKLKE